MIKITLTVEVNEAVVGLTPEIAAELHSINHAAEWIAALATLHPTGCGIICLPDRLINTQTDTEPYRTVPEAIIRNLLLWKDGRTRKTGSIENFKYLTRKELRYSLQRIYPNKYKAGEEASILDQLTPIVAGTVTSTVHDEKINTIIDDIVKDLKRQLEALYELDRILD